MCASRFPLIRSSSRCWRCRARCERSRPWTVPCTCQALASTTAGAVAACDSATRTAARPRPAIASSLTELAVSHSVRTAASSDPGTWAFP